MSQLRLRKILTTVFSLMAISIVVAGCGTSADNAEASSAPDAVHNEVDVKFAQDMIPHHEQAVQMAAMVPTHSDNPELRKLADQISAAQQPEIDQLTTWLTDWGQPLPESGGHGGHSMDGPGMMDEAQMGALENTHGDGFDQMWLTMMIEHHEGAIEMAKAEIAGGINPSAQQMAQQIIDSQSAEIARMRKMLETNN